MIISELVAKLLSLQAIIGDAQVTISDGYQCRFYQGNYTVESFNDNGHTVADIGIGGCELTD